MVNFQNLPGMQPVVQENYLVSKVLIKRFITKHSYISNLMPLISDYCKAMLVQQPPYKKLEWYEDKCMHCTKASIHLD